MKSLQRFLALWIFFFSKSWPRPTWTSHRSACALASSGFCSKRLLRSRCHTSLECSCAACEPQALHSLVRLWLLTNCEAAEAWLSAVGGNLNSRSLECSALLRRSVSLSGCQFYIIRKYLFSTDVLHKQLNHPMFTFPRASVPVISTQEPNIFSYVWFWPQKCSYLQFYFLKWIILLQKSQKSWIIKGPKCRFLKMLFSIYFKICRARKCTILMGEKQKKSVWKCTVTLQNTNHSYTEWAFILSPFAEGFYKVRF